MHIIFYFFLFIIGFDTHLLVMNEKEENIFLMFYSHLTLMVFSTNKYHASM